MDAFLAILLFLLSAGVGFGGQAWIGELFRRKQLPGNLDKRVLSKKGTPQFKNRLVKALRGGKGNNDEILAALPAVGMIIMGAAGIPGFAAGAFWGAVAGVLTRVFSNMVFQQKNKFTFKEWKKKQNRRAALKAINAVSVQEATHALQYAVNKLNDESFLFLVPNLKKLPKEVVSQVMLAATRHPTPWIQRRAAEVLAWHYPDTVLDKMPQLLSRPDREFRKNIYGALLKVPASLALPWLNKGKLDRAPEVRLAIQGYEREITQRKKWPDYALPAAVNPYGDYLNEVSMFWSGYWNAEWEEAEAIKALTEGAQEENWYEYLEILKQNPDRPFILNLVQMLADHRRDPRITVALLQLLLHADPVVAEAAEEALEQKGSPAVKEIRIRWTGLNTGVKEKLIQRVPSLKNISREEIWETYITALKDPKSAVKLAALESIRKIDEIWMLNLLLSYCKFMPDPNNAAFQDAEWLAARHAVDQWFKKLPIKAEAAAMCFCNNCLQRGMVMQRSIWQVPVCRKCKNFEFLVPNIVEVVGRIGPKLETNLPMGSMYPVDLWDGERQLAQYADVDRVEVIGGAEFDYDWAVTATLETLKNSDQPERAAVPFNLLEEPPISVNTLRMLNNREKTV